MDWKLETVVRRGMGEPKCESIGVVVEFCVFPFENFASPDIRLGT